MCCKFSWTGIISVPYYRLNESCTTSAITRDSLIIEILISKESWYTCKQYKGCATAIETKAKNPVSINQQEEVRPNSSDMLFASQKKVYAFMWKISRISRLRTASHYHRDRSCFAQCQERKIIQFCKIVPQNIKAVSRPYLLECLNSSLMKLYAVFMMCRIYDKHNLVSINCALYNVYLYNDSYVLAKSAGCDFEIVILL
ncbi:Hypothetical_protein [Hexamita inflata]|uniref:Hypothetical_protein n=1 Tax=Hexamita inflata TaxID=28002 RepID=A0AA86TPU1_9EUKA|nr:Hypothetical protein HINF_LOCUS9962 [Hexamita inflata]